MSEVIEMKRRDYREEIGSRASVAGTVRAAEGWEDVGSVVQRIVNELVIQRV